ncbi:MAG: flagellar biosynthesis anti-sigma factor FlgM [Nitrospirae bacterium]|nr:flagellar biosynthesis anti-sigma factor FlgM [Nitrospirota bacterium]
MRIDGNNPIDNKDLFKVQESAGNLSAEKKQDVEKSDAEKDKISLSGKSKEIGDLKAAIDQLPDVRTEKVDALKQALDTGTYNIDARKIAQKILEEI